MSEELADNVRRYRRRAGLSQEELAHQSGFSVGTISKIEQGGSVRIETLHAIARGLGVRTSELLVSGAPTPVRHNDPNDLNLRDLRIALTPRVRLTAAPPPTGDEPNLRLLRRAIRDAVTLYPAGRYASLAAALPPLVRDANAAVAYYEGSEEESRKALLARAEVLGLAGRYLTQVRQFDIAHVAAAASVNDTVAAKDDVAAANRVRGLCFTLLRTGRFDEAEELAVEAMDLIEPKISDVDPDRYSVWGGVAMEAAAAAIRNNRPQEAREYRRVASIAVAAIGHPHKFDSFSVFGPVTAAMKSLEDSMIIGDARTVVRRSAEDEALSPKAWGRLGKPSTTDGSRYVLDLARAHVHTGDALAGMDEMMRLYRSVPEWLRHQKLAAVTMEEIMKKRKRTLTTDMRVVADHLRISG
ncbi:MULTISPECIES: helix-turn-helix domain-containing protein [unclassified Streptomyces]|uniref:helix-turn-helix domain-containing protein n=1 Tax=unclassified Streptomyces TaxID=2593676 RepID=UPI002E2B2DC5|nr:helix-turn-helix transcriptional regulator [Streptomyces sp. NBC_00223]